MNILARIYRYIKEDYEREQKRKRQSAYMDWYCNPKYDD